MCKKCGENNPSQNDHVCEIRCALCKEAHLTGAKECKGKLKFTTMKQAGTQPGAAHIAKATKSNTMVPGAENVPPLQTAAGTAPHLVQSGGATSGGTMCCTCQGHSSGAGQPVNPRTASGQERKKKKKTNTSQGQARRTCSTWAPASKAVCVEKSSFW